MSDEKEIAYKWFRHCFLNFELEVSDDNIRKLFEQDWKESHKKDDGKKMGNG